MSAGRLPDFIIVGAMKCATSTLHEQLARQPGIVMSEPKEPCFFSDDPVYAKGIDWYTSLFADAGPDDLAGESSTHYTKLPTYPETVNRMKTHVPHVKCIYVMRDPIDRLVSQYMHQWTRREVDEPIDQAIESHPELVAYSRYAYQLAPFIEAFGTSAVLPVFFERLTTYPNEELRRVCHFIGYDRAEPRWREEAARENRSDQRMRPNALRDWLAYAPIMSTIRQRLVPQSMRERIKNLWRMQERPELSEEKRAQVTAILNDDLATLGAWLGIELDCANFKDQVRDLVPSWRESLDPNHAYESAR